MMGKDAKKIFETHDIEAHYRSSDVYTISDDIADGHDIAAPLFITVSHTFSPNILPFYTHRGRLDAIS